MSMELWAVRLDRALTEEEEELLLALTPPERRRRLVERTRRELWREPLCAYGALALALREAFGWKSPPEIALTPQGKPYFPGRPEAAFSLSHTGGLVLVGLATGLTGVDAEKIRPLRRRTMALLSPSAGTEEEFFRDWVRREARAKRTGTAVGAALRREAPPCPEERYQPLDLFPGYAAGAAWAAEEPLGEIRRRTMEEFLRRLAQKD